MNCDVPFSYIYPLKRRIQERYVFMKLKKNVWLAVILLSLSQCITAQIISGKVMDKHKKAGLISAEVTVYKNGIPINTTTTNFQGEYEIQTKGGDELEATYLGYDKTRQKINLNKENNIYLKEGYTFSSSIQIKRDPVIIKAKYKTRSNYTSIDQEEIRAISPQNPQKLYNNIPGLYMHAGALNTNRITIRGIGSRSPFSTTKIRAYLNDIPLTNGVGETNLEDLNLGLVNKIEIYKGPSASRHGASLGGVIHYRTTVKNDRKRYFNSDISYGSFNTIATSHGASTQLTRRSRLTINHNLLSTDGYRDNNKLLRQNLTGFYQLNSGRSIVSVFANLTDVDAFIPSSLNIEDYENTPSAAAGNWEAAKGKEEYQKTQIGISYQYETQDRLSSSITGFLNTFENNERRPFNVLNQIAINMGIRSRLTKSYDHASITIGSELFKENEDYSTYVTLDEGQGDILSDNYEQRKYANLFLEGDHQWNRFSVEGGVNVNFTRYDLNDKFFADSIDQSGNYNFDPVISPRLSLSYKSSEKKIYYASFSHGFSAPTLSETLTPDGQINPDIQPETGWNAEIGYRGKFPFKTEIDLSLYYMWISNLLVAERIGEDAFVGKNAGRTSHPGIEVALSREFIIHKKLLLGINTNYQFAPHRFQEFIDNNIDFNGKTLPGNPVHKWNAALNYKYKNYYGNVSHLLVGSTFADDINETSVDGYQVTDLLVGIKILRGLGKWTLNLEGTIQNIFDTKYASMIAVNPQSFGSNLPRYLYPGLPRNYMIRVKGKYKW